jgi:hypothetical protein
MLRLRKPDIKAGEIEAINREIAGLQAAIRGLSC